MRIRAVITTLLVCSAFLYAGDTNQGKNGLAYLKIPIDARAIGMGEAYTAVTEDASAVYWNPAGLMRARRSNVLFNHNEWLQGVRGEFAALSFVRDKSAWGFHLRSFNIAEIPVRVIASTDPLENTSAHYFSAGISYARRMNDKLNVGITAKYLFEKIYVESATGFAADLGVDYQTGMTGLKLGATVQNLGKMGVLKSEGSQLPMIARVGFQYLLPWQTSQLNGRLASDVVYIADENVRFHVGTEWIVWQQIAVRGGFLVGYQARNFSLGLGFNRSALRLDYGFIPFGEDLGSTHRFTLNFLL